MCVSPGSVHFGLHDVPGAGRHGEQHDVGCQPMGGPSSDRRL